jgi:hypothetical protein
MLTALCAWFRWQVTAWLSGARSSARASSSVSVPPCVVATIVVADVASVLLHLLFLPQWKSCSRAISSRSRFVPVVFVCLIVVLACCRGLRLLCRSLTEPACLFASAQDVADDATLVAAAKKVGLDADEAAKVRATVSRLSSQLRVALCRAGSTVSYVVPQPCCAQGRVATINRWPTVSMFVAPACSGPQDERRQRGGHSGGAERVRE